VKHNGAGEMANFSRTTVRPVQPTQDFSFPLPLFQLANRNKRLPVRGSA